MKFFIFIWTAQASILVCLMNLILAEPFTCKSQNSSKADNALSRLHRYQYFPDSERLEMKKKAKEMFYFGYDSYMKYAFPEDELNPIYCRGRGPDKDNPDNLNVNDALGGYSLTLVDALDTLAIMGNHSEFKHAVMLVLKSVSFDHDNVVQVFEATIRILGGLLAAHLLATDPMETFGSLLPEGYDDGLLYLAHDLAIRLLPAFDKSETKLPWPRVNLRHGVPEDCSSHACTAGIGTLVLEFGILGRLLNDPTYENVARRALDALWMYRSSTTGLFGNVIDVRTGEWVGKMSGIGAGVDSFYEYLLKSYVLFGDQADLKKFNDVYASVRKHLRKGRSFCNNGTGDVPLFVNVDMETGRTLNTWIDSLQASFTGVQVLRGDLDEAICSHAIYYGIWRRYGALPERFNWHLKEPDLSFYPLRPEFCEATYLLYQATKHPFYLHVGAEILHSLDSHAKAPCGYATLHDVRDKSQEDRMESFFLSETMKYLYLLFDFENPLNVQASEWIFSTEGHAFKLQPIYREKEWRREVNGNYRGHSDVLEKIFSSRYNDTKDSKCTVHNSESRFSFLPLEETYFSQIEEFVGLRL